MSDLSRELAIETDAAALGQELVAVADDARQHLADLQRGDGPLVRRFVFAGARTMPDPKATMPMYTAG